MPRRVLLEGPTLEGLLARVHEEIGPGARIVKAERVRSGGLAGFFAKEHYELTIDVPDPGTVHWHQPRVSTKAGIDQLLAAADDAERLEMLDEAGVETVGASGELSRPKSPPEPEEARTSVSTDSEAFASVLASVQRLGGNGTEEVSVARSPESGPAIRLSNSSPARRGAPDDAAVHALRSLGVPEAILAALPPGMGLTGLARAMEQVPVAPPMPSEPGSLIAVVGPQDQALEVALRLAPRLRLEPQDIALAGDVDPVQGHGRRLQTALAAARHAERASELDRAALVVVGVGWSEEETTSGAEILAALAPNHRIAVLDAGRKAADLRAWLRRANPDGFDEVAAFGVAITTQPGTLLDLEVPVGWLDGLRATRLTWVASLAERLEQLVEDG